MQMQPIQAFIKKHPSLEAWGVRVVSLLIVDQRPSQIYDEVMSQLGTRVSGWLGDDLDIQAAQSVSGLSGRDVLRGMLARLQPKEESLLLGWGMPQPARRGSRRYDDAFWKERITSKSLLIFSKAHF